MLNKRSPSRVLVIGGPTASGKSTLAVMLAERLNGTIINADSLQLYSALPILTALPQPDIMSKIPHRLYGVLQPDEGSTVAKWQALAHAAIEETLAHGMTPIVVGGTGLYLEALIRGLAAIPPIPPELRHRADSERLTMGNAAFHARLVAADPLAAHLKPGDTQRTLRAWEVWTATGRSLFAWQRDPHAAPPYEFTCLALLPDRARLYATCDARFLDMIAQGGLEEIRCFLGSWPDTAPAARALGFRELATHLRGELALSQAIAAAQAATRHYAKRQTTWFRNRYVKQMGARSLGDVPDEKMADKISDEFRTN